MIEWRNEAELLAGRIDLLVGNAVAGFLLILAVLAVTLEARVAAWVVVGIATAFASSFVLMAALGATISQLSLFGFILALGVGSTTRSSSERAPLLVANPGCRPGGRPRRASSRSPPSSSSRSAPRCAPSRLC